MLVLFSASPQTAPCLRLAFVKQSVSSCVLCWQEDHYCVGVDHLSLLTASRMKCWKKKLTARAGGRYLVFEKASNPVNSFPLIFEKTSANILITERH